MHSRAGNRASSLPTHYFFPIRLSMNIVKYNFQKVSHSNIMCQGRIINFSRHPFYALPRKKCPAEKTLISHSGGGSHLGKIFQKGVKSFECSLDEANFKFQTRLISIPGFRFKLTSSRPRAYFVPNKLSAWHFYSSSHQHVKKPNEREYQSQLGNYKDLVCTLVDVNLVIRINTIISTRQKISDKSKKLISRH